MLVVCNNANENCVWGDDDTESCPHSLAHERFEIADWTKNNVPMFKPCTVWAKCSQTSRKVRCVRCQG